MYHLAILVALVALVFGGFITVSTAATWFLIYVGAIVGLLLLTLLVAAVVVWLAHR